MKLLRLLKRPHVTGLVFILVSLGGCMDKVEIVDQIPDAGISKSEEKTGLDSPYDWTYATKTVGFTGVDILMVVDNSSSMAEEQAVLATEIYALITKLTYPTKDVSYIGLPAIRLAVASTDMGLQSVDDGIASIPADLYVNSCTGEGRSIAGDDGAFLGKLSNVTTVDLNGSRIECDADGGQCPPDWTCQGGFCTSPGGNATVNCPSAGSSWLEHSATSPNFDLARQAACMAMQGTTGCGVEQQLKAAVQALTIHPEFLVQGHALLVMVVSDEEDCSIESSELFRTEEFQDQKKLNTACNLPVENEEYLVDPLDLKDELIVLKGGVENSVYFAAIVGVPGGENSPCRGFGDQVSAMGCLDDPLMEITTAIFEDSNGTEYNHFAAACTRMENDAEITTARPGRRFVELASAMGQQGYVQSICDANWAATVGSIAEVLLRNNAYEQCGSPKLPWAPLELPIEGCSFCGQTKCELYAEFFYQGENLDDKSCPKELYFDDDYEQRIIVKEFGDGFKVSCPVRELPAEFACKEAHTRYAESDQVGWYYCDVPFEGTEQDCRDLVDNDHDGAIDCADRQCADCLVCPGGTGAQCGRICPKQVYYTPRAMAILNDTTMNIKCYFGTD